MKIILVNKFHYLKGGSETYCFGLAEGLRAAGHEVHFFAMQGEENVPCEDSDLFVSARDYNGPTSLGQKASAAASLVYSKEAREKFQALCERVRPDVVHMNLVHRQITLSILDAPYLKEHPVPVLFTAHDYILVCPSYLMLDGNGEVCDECLGGSFVPCARKRCVKGSRVKSLLAVAEASFLKHHGSYRKIDRVIAPSEFMRSKLLEGGFPFSQVVAMPNFVDGGVMTRAREGADGTDRESPYILYFGRLSAEKGVDVLLEAFGRVAGVLSDGWRLLVVGDGPERAALESLLGDGPLRGRVEFAGFQSGEVLLGYVRGAALAVVPSRWRENMPCSIVEALAVGTPVIGTRIGGIPELVVEGRTGFLCEPDDAASLADAIVRGVGAFDDCGGYALMQRRCRDYVAEHCDQDAYVRWLEGQYAELSDEEVAWGGVVAVGVELMLEAGAWRRPCANCDGQGSPYFLYFGRLSDEKGVDVLLEAFLSVRDDLPVGMRLVIAGDGVQREALERMAPCEDVEFAGFLQGEELEKCVRDAAFAACPSRCRENMPYSIVEAFAVGTPVIGTRIGGIPELVVDGQTGFLCEPGDASSLADAMVRASRVEEEEYTRMQQCCRNYVIRCCDQDTYMRWLVALYERLASERDGRA